MIDILYLSVAFSTGMLLGLFYFGALWLTVQRLARARHPKFSIFGGFLIRSGITMVGFYLVMGGLWYRVVACLFGFLSMRKILVRRWGAST